MIWRAYKARGGGSPAPGEPGTVPGDAGYRLPTNGSKQSILLADRGNPSFPGTGKVYEVGLAYPLPGVYEAPVKWWDPGLNSVVTGTNLTTSGEQSPPYHGLGDMTGAEQIPPVPSISATYLQDYDPDVTDADMEQLFTRHWDADWRGGSDLFAMFRDAMLSGWDEDMLPIIGGSAYHQRTFELIATGSDVGGDCVIAVRFCGVQRGAVWFDQWARSVSFNDYLLPAAVNEPSFWANIEIRFHLDNGTVNGWKGYVERVGEGYASRDTWWTPDANVGFRRLPYPQIFLADNGGNVPAIGSNAQHALPRLSARATWPTLSYDPLGLVTLDNIGVRAATPDPTCGVWVQYRRPGWLIYRRR